MNLKIFEITNVDHDEKDWVAAYGVIHAIQVYCLVTGMDLVEFNRFDEIVEIPKEDWGKYHQINDDHLITFEQWMNENTTADLIAGTSYLDKPQYE